MNWDQQLDGYLNDGKSKEQYHRKARAVFKKVAGHMNLEKGDYDIRTNKGGPAVHGETTLHTKQVYVKIGYMGGGILYRKCDGLKDYSGSTNNWMDNNIMNDEVELSNKLINFLKN